MQNQTENIMKQKIIKLPPQVTRFIFVKNIPYKITPEELYDIFWKFGPVRQIRRGITNKNKGTCFVVYDDIFDAKKAVDRLSGFNVAGKYLVCFYYNPNKNKKMFN
jgi:pre-mRNA branch site protein p14